MAQTGKVDESAILKGDMTLGLELKISKLKHQKTVTKTALTKSKNKLLELLEEECPSRKTIRENIDKVVSLQSKAVGIIVSLSEAYKDAGDVDKFKKTTREIEPVEEEIDEAVNMAQTFLKNTLSTSGSSVRSGFVRMFKQESEHKPEIQLTVQQQTEVTTLESAVSVDQQVVNTEPKQSSQRFNDSPVAKGSSLIVPKITQTHPTIGEDMWKQLRRVSIPTFHGKVLEYEGWKAAFMACVDSAPATNQYKLLQLKQYLSGEPAQLVANLGHSSVAYDVALERLDRKYGGRRRQIALKLEEISNFKPIRPGNPRDLDRFADMLDVAVVSLRENDKIEELGDGCLYSLLQTKMTEQMLVQYQRWIYEFQRQESVETLREWILQEAEFHVIASEAKHGLSSKSKATEVRFPVKSGSFFGAKDSYKTQWCNVCHLSNHEARSCKQLKCLDVSKRWDKVKQLKLCFRCLGVGHLGRSCAISAKCGIDGCQATHHQLLHGTVKPAINQSLDLETKQANRLESITMPSNKMQSHTSALRTIPVILKSACRRVKVNALLDNASTQTYLNEDVAAELKLEGPSQSVSVNVLKSKTETFSSSLVQFGIESVDGSVDMSMTALTTTKVTGKMPVTDWSKQSRWKWKHLEGIPFPKPASPPVVDLLIGMDFIELHSSLQDVCGLPGQPIARKTPLGWTCVGNIPDITASGKQMLKQSFYSSKTNPEKDEVDLDNLIHRFWETEEVHSPEVSLSHDDQSAVNTVKTSVVYQNGRYKVGIPWKESPEVLPNDYQMACNRLVNTEKKLSKDESIAKAYDDVIAQYQTKGYIRKVPATETKDSRWYLPHFPVVKLDRVTTKVRLVFDASAKCNGICLNDVIHQGPKLQNDLFAILIRFRKHPIAIICDVSEMYLQIEISEADRPYLRFLWRSGDNSRQQEIYEFLRVVFGLNCSPFLAQYITQEHARRHGTDLPLAAETITEFTYMDDSMNSVATEKEALELYEQLKTIWNAAGMHARKWVSNSKSVLKEIPVEDRLHEINIQMSALPSVKALGLLWNAESDEFRFGYSHKEELFSMTKRSFLRETEKLYDPLGLLAPFIIRAKVLLQKMWLAGIGWDEPINPELQSKTWKWYREINELPSLVFRRHVGSNDDQSELKLHVFVDASEEAFGAVVYGVSCHDNSATSQIVAAKSRVAPLKATSIPRLELLAAVLGVRLAEVVASPLHVDLKSAVFWSDSQNVLWWVKSQSRNFKSFVSNRVSFIQEKTKPSQWRYVPTVLNPADLITKGAKVQELNNASWTDGPKYITEEDSNWPEQPEFEPKEKTELRKRTPQIAVSFVSDTSVNEDQQSWRLNPARFSSWKKLCRVTAWTFRFANNLRLPAGSRQIGELSAEEIQDAETHVLVTAQKEAFALECSLLSKGKPVPSSSKLVSLKPVLDDNGLIRSSGRLRFADVLSLDAQHPIILPRHHWVTRLIVKYHHENCNHMDTNTTLAEISTRFWILSARGKIREWENLCAWCKRRKSKPTVQVMGDLPKVRGMTSLKAFERVGVDFAGPFMTKHGRGKTRQKRYLCLFTCLSTRAVHLEIAFGLDADSFLNAFFRMSHRRGLPKEVISDNGTNFVGANKELRELVSSLDSKHVTSTFATKGITWRFNPPYAPHFGGVFESLIKSAKRSISAVLGTGDLTDEDLMTAFTGAEAMLNSRPLTYQSANPEDDVPLTPNHFLHGQCGGLFAPDIDDSVMSLTRRWRRVQELLRHVWKRWMKEWLTTLNVRKKWFATARDISIGDVVILWPHLSTLHSSSSEESVREDKYINPVFAYDNEMQSAYKFYAPREEDVMTRVHPFRSKEDAGSSTDITSDISDIRRANCKFCLFLGLVLALVAIVLGSVVVAILLTQETRAPSFERLQSSIHVSDVPYTAALRDYTSQDYKAASTRFCDEVDTIVKQRGSPLAEENPECRVIEIRNQNGTLFVYEILVKSSADMVNSPMTDLLAQYIIQQSKDGRLGTLIVDPAKPCGFIKSSSSESSVKKNYCPTAPAKTTPVPPTTETSSASVASSESASVSQPAESSLVTSSSSSIEQSSSSEIMSSSMAASTEASQPSIVTVQMTSPDSTSMSVSSHVKQTMSMSSMSISGIAASSTSLPHPVSTLSVTVIQSSSPLDASPGISVSTSRMPKSTSVIMSQGASSDTSSHESRSDSAISSPQSSSIMGISPSQSRSSLEMVSSSETVMTSKSGLSESETPPSSSASVDASASTTLVSSEVPSHSVSVGQSSVSSSFTAAMTQSQSLEGQQTMSTSSQGPVGSASASPASQMTESSAVSSSSQINPSSVPQMSPPSMMSQMDSSSGASIQPVQASATMSSSAVLMPTQMASMSSSETQSSISSLVSGSQAISSAASSSVVMGTLSVDMSTSSASSASINHQASLMATTSAQLSPSMSASSQDSVSAHPSSSSAIMSQSSHMLQDSSSMSSQTDESSSVTTSSTSTQLGETSSQMIGSSVSESVSSSASEATSEASQPTPTAVASDSLQLSVMESSISTSSSSSSIAPASETSTIQPPSSLGTTPDSMSASESVSSLGSVSTQEPVSTDITDSTSDVIQATIAASETSSVLTSQPVQSSSSAIDTTYSLESSSSSLNIIATSTSSSASFESIGVSPSTVLDSMSPSATSSETSSFESSSADASMSSSNLPNVESSSVADTTVTGSMSSSATSSIQSNSGVADTTTIATTVALVSSSGLSNAESSSVADTAVASIMSSSATPSIQSNSGIADTTSMSATVASLSSSVLSSNSVAETVIANSVSSSATTSIQSSSDVAGTDSMSTTSLLESSSGVSNTIETILSSSSIQSNVASAISTSMSSNLENSSNVDSSLSVSLSEQSVPSATSVSTQSSSDSLPTMESTTVSISASELMSSSIP